MMKKNSNSIDHSVSLFSRTHFGSTYRIEIQITQENTYGTNIEWPKTHLLPWPNMSLKSLYQLSAKLFIIH